MVTSLPVSPAEPLSGRDSVSTVAPVVCPRCETSIWSAAAWSVMLYVMLVTVYVLPANENVVPEPSWGVYGMSYPSLHQTS